MLCQTGAEKSDAAIFQCPMMTDFSLSGYEGTATESATLRSRYHNGSLHDKDTYDSKTKKDTIFINNNNINYNNNDFQHDTQKTDLDAFESRITGNLPEEGRVGKREPSARMKELLQGLNEPGDALNPPQPPAWLDQELFHRGQQFYERYLFSIFFSDLLSLLMMFSVDRILRPLIYTKRSDTPQRALRRYVSTIMHIITWYTGDVWNPDDQAHTDILSIRSIHSMSAAHFNSSQICDKLKNISVKDKGHLESSCPFSPAIRHDLTTQVVPGVRLDSTDCPVLYISQWDMAVTQYSFLGIMLAHPHQMGARWVTEEDLEGFVHFWRGIGWLLGIADQYNFCNGTVAETRALCKEMERLVIVPHISMVDWNHEHMSSSLIQGINYMVPCVSYPAMFRFLADTLDLSVPTFSYNMGLQHTFQYWLMRFVFHILFLVPAVITIFNWLLKLALEIIQNNGPSWIPKTWRPATTITRYNYR